MQAIMGPELLERTSMTANLLVAAQSTALAKLVPALPYMFTL